MTATHALGRPHGHHRPHAHVDAPADGPWVHGTDGRVLVLGVDGWSRYDAAADHLARAVLEGVRRRLGDGAAARAVVATHDVHIPGGRAAVSCVVPDADLGQDEATVHARVLGLVEALAGLLPGSGAVVATAGGLRDGIDHGEDPRALTGAWVALAAAATETSGRLVGSDGRDVVATRVPVAGVRARPVVEVAGPARTSR